MRMCLKAKNGPLPWTKFFGKNHITFIYLLALFIAQNFKKFLQRIQSYEDAPFLGPKWSIYPKQIFFWKIISFPSSYYPLSLCKIFKKFFQRIQSYENAQFLGPKYPMRIFFRKPVNVPCFFHSCLSTCQKPKSDINLLAKYWWLKNTEISLAKSHFLL